MVVPPAPAEPPAEPTAKLTVECACGRRLHAPANLAGKRVRCPHCGEAVAISAGRSPQPQSDDPLGIADLAGMEAAAAALPTIEPLEDLNQSPANKPTRTSKRAREPPYGSACCWSSGAPSLPC